MGALDEAGFEPDPEDDSPDRRQRPMEVDRYRYYETGRLAMSISNADGLPEVVGGADVQLPESGLMDDSFVCNAALGSSDPTGKVRQPRPACEHYRAILVPAPGVARGFEAMREIRRFCMRLSTPSELFELGGDLYACLSREPRDEQSARLIEDFEAKQKKMAQETAEESGQLDF